MKEILSETIAAHYAYNATTTPQNSASTTCEDNAYYFPPSILVYGRCSDHIYLKTGILEKKRMHIPVGTKHLPPGNFPDHPVDVLGDIRGDRRQPEVPSHSLSVDQGWSDRRELLKDHMLDIVNLNAATSLPSHQIFNFYEAQIYEIPYSPNTEPDIESRTARRGEV
ncbi:hypothetical protein B0H19DRAFT_1076550 [Mycena capillaripes]|nr:hypothetical protein B0H19DRAFT_1076550 [Mycena capillaripes]